jgi:thioredoxin:protein disulfide reductase
MNFPLNAVVLLISLPAFTQELPSRMVVEGVSNARLKAGGGFDVRVELKVKDGFHVQANPASRPQLIPTKVDVRATAEIDVDRPVYPKPKPYRIAGLETMVDTLEGRFEVKVPLKAKATTRPGKYELEGKVRYQACDDKVCFPPTVAKFSVPVEIVP